MTEVAVSVSGISKSFVIPHERRATVREHVVNFFRRVDYEKLEVLKEVSFDVRKGEFLGIVGRNGSGKSTLLKILTGIFVPSSGSIVTNGVIAPFLELGVGFNAELTARDNIYLYGAMLGIPHTQLKKRFNDILSFAELERFVDTKLKNFSSGMAVRLAFSVAIEMDADIYLLDEVLAVGDQEFQRKCLNVFEEFKQQGKTVILVSHNAAAIQRYCDRALYISNGNAVFCGAVDAALAEYSKDIS